MAINGIHHPSICTPDLDRLLQFYCDVVGFEVVFRSEWSEGSAAIDAIVGVEDSSGRMAMLRASNCYLELIEYRKPRTVVSPQRTEPYHRGYAHICLDVTDIDLEYGRLQKAGMTFHAPPPSGPSGPGRAIYGRDPDGNIVELQELTDREWPFHLAKLGVGA